MPRNKGFSSKRLKRLSKLEVSMKQRILLIDLTCICIQEAKTCSSSCELSDCDSQHEETPPKTISDWQSHITGFGWMLVKKTK